jgi:hypothetical protein
MTLSVEQLETNSVLALGLTGEYPNSSLLPDKKAVADSIKPGCFYLNSIYNATTKQVLCHVFVSGVFLVRVYQDNRTELFEKDCVVGGVKYDYVYFENNLPITYYKTNGDGLSFSEYTFSDNTKQWDKFSQGYGFIPEDKKQLLNDFAHKDRIFAWSNQPIGLIVEYVEPLI